MKSIVFSAFCFFVVQTYATAQPEVVLNSIVPRYPIYPEPVIPLGVVYNLSNYPRNATLFIFYYFQSRLRPSTQTSVD